MGRTAQMMIALAVFAMLTSVYVHAADPTIEDLIKQLGHEDRNVYKAAKKSLLAKGYSAYRPLSAVKTDDPAVQEAVAEIMEAVKFSIIPGAEGDVRQLYDALDRNETGAEAWAAIVEKAPEKVIDVIVEISRDEKRAKELHRGLKAFLRGVRPIKAAAHLAAMPMADRKAFVRHLDRANSEFYFSKYEQGLLFFCMNDYKRAVGRLGEYWKREGNPDAIKLAAAAIARSRDPLTFWTIGGRRIMSSSTLSVRCKEAAFFCGIANALNKPHLVESFYNLADVGGAPSGAGSLMFEVLEEHGDQKLLDDFLNAAQGPVLKYVLLHRYFAETDERIPGPELNAIILGAGGENNLMMLAKEALRIDRADAKVMLEAILNGAPFGTLYVKKVYDNEGKFTPFKVGS